MSSRPYRFLQMLVALAFFAIVSFACGVLAWDLTLRAVDLWRALWPHRHSLIMDSRGRWIGPVEASPVGDLEETTPVIGGGGLFGGRTFRPPVISGMR